MNTAKTIQGLVAPIMMISAVFMSGCTDTTTGAKVTGADPGVLEAPIAYVRRPVPVDEDGDFIQSDVFEPLFFAEGGDVIIRSNSTVTATETNITRVVTNGRGDVKDLKPNLDGTKLAFALRLEDLNPNDDDIPVWNLYEYDLTQNKLRCLMDFDATTVECDGSQADKGDDLAPAYLPDGRIVFSSNRQSESRKIQLDLNRLGGSGFKAMEEGDDEWAMYLHIMDEREDLATDPLVINQISFNQSHDLDPSVLTHHLSGQIMFSRWDNAASNKGMHLYTIKPDGTEQQILYGRHSHNTGNNNAGTDDAPIHFTQAEEMEDGRIMFIARPDTGTFGGGSIQMIDIQNYINNNQPVDPLMPVVDPAQTVATINNVSAADELSLGGRYSAAWPLWDGTDRILISKSSCEILADGVNRPCVEPYLSANTVEEVSPAYAIWLYDLNDNAQKVVVQAEPGIVFTDVVAIQSRTTQPDYIFDNASANYSAAMATDGFGAIHIKSVYDFGGGNPQVFSNDEACFLNECLPAVGVSTVSDLADPSIVDADSRPARFVRFVTSVPLPDEDDTSLDPEPDLQNEAFGRQRNQDMREIIGYAPVEPDGSVKVQVPANTPLAVSVLDKLGRRIGPRHQNWFHVRPGETLECSGCHDGTNDTTAHHRYDAEASSINPGMPATGFPNTLNPVDGMPYPIDFGKTMAEVLFDNAADEPKINADIEFDDYWTDPMLTPSASFSYRYSAMDTLLKSPASSFCASNDAFCRILINYQEHIHPLWSLPRGAADVDTCTNCHRNSDLIDPNIDVLPDGQLDLTDGLSDQNGGVRLKSFRELFFTDAGQELDAMGALMNIQISQDIPILDANGDPVLDAMGNPTFNTILIDDPNAVVAPSMSANGARSSFFINKMTSATATRNGSLDPADPNYVDHSSFMVLDELRMITEWLDIGAQYYNNPRDPQCITDGLC